MSIVFHSLRHLVNIVNSLYWQSSNKPWKSCWYLDTLWTASSGTTNTGLLFCFHRGLSDTWSTGIRVTVAATGTLLLEVYYSWVDYCRQPSESGLVSATTVISTCWRLIPMMWKLVVLRFEPSTYGSESECSTHYTTALKHGVSEGSGCGYMWSGLGLGWGLRLGLGLGFTISVTDIRLLISLLL